MKSIDKKQGRYIINNKVVFYEYKNNHIIVGYDKKKVSKTSVYFDENKQCCRCNFKHDNVVFVEIDEDNENYYRQCPVCFINDITRYFLFGSVTLTESTNEELKDYNIKRINSFTKKCLKLVGII